MKPSKGHILTIASALTAIGVSAQAAFAGDPAPPTRFNLNGDFGEKVVLTLVGAVFGFLSAYGMAWIQRRRSRKRISYDLTIKRAEPPIDTTAGKDAQKKLEITYDKRPVQELMYVSYDLMNVGGTKIKQHFFRFEFSKSVDVLDWYYSSKPKPEQGVEVETDALKTDREIRFRIGDLDPKERVGFRFVVSGKASEPVKVIPRGEDGVEVVSGALEKEQDDIAKLRVFFVYLVLFLAISFGLSDLPLGGIARMILFLPMLPFLGPVSRVLASAVARVSSQAGDETGRGDVNIVFNDRAVTAVSVDRGHSSLLVNNAALVANEEGAVTSLPITAMRAGEVPATTKLAPDISK